MKDYRWINDNEYFELFALNEDKSLNLLLVRRDLARYNIEKCAKKKDFEMLKRYWKIEHVINKILEERGCKDKKKETNSLTERIMEGKSELIDNFIRNAKELLLRAKK